MAKRFTDTEIWDKEWFMKLNPKLKCLVKLVRDKCDLSGVWSPNWTLANNYVGESVSEDDLLKIDNGEQFFKMPGGKIFCLGFIQFQYGELSEKSPVHRKIINLLATHKIDHKHPINRVEEKEEEEVKDKEAVKVKEGVRSNVFLHRKEIEKLQTQYSDVDIGWMYDKLSAYKLSKGKNYKSDYGAILSWVVDELKEKKEKKIINGKSDTEARKQSVGELKNLAENVLDQLTANNSNTSV